STLIAQGKKIARSVRPEKTENLLNICFLTMLGGHVHNLSVDIVLAWGLRQKGHNVYFVIDDQSLPISEMTKINQENRWEELSANSYNFAYKYIKNCGFRAMGISEIIDTGKERDIIPFNSIIEAGLLKHFKVGVISDDLPMVNEKRKLLESSTRISALVEIIW